MFKIHPEIPESLSSEAKSFILSCFEPDPNKRATAGDLLKDLFLRQNIKGKKSKIAFKPSGKVSYQVLLSAAVIIMWPGLTLLVISMVCKAFWVCERAHMDHFSQANTQSCQTPPIAQHSCFSALSGILATGPDCSQPADCGLDWTCTRDGLEQQDLEKGRGQRKAHSMASRYHHKLFPSCRTCQLPRCPWKAFSGCGVSHKHAHCFLTNHSDFFDIDRRQQC